MRSIQDLSKSKYVGPVHQLLYAAETNAAEPSPWGGRCPEGADEGKTLEALSYERQVCDAFPSSVTLRVTASPQGEASFAHLLT